MDKCCEEFDKNDMDCQMMYLMGGDMGFIYPNKTKNISLIYPNMYLHNRKGRCSIAIRYKIEDMNSTQEVKHCVKFNTYVNEESTSPVLNGYYEKSEKCDCVTLDQDPLEKCEPVDCHMKYLGSRNFFNLKYMRCQKVPICVANPEKTTPDVSYFPTSNSCRDLQTPISVEDLKQLEQVASENCSGLSPLLYPANLYCHHGAPNNETGFCVCNRGWISAPMDKDQFEPSLFIYHMCNIELNTWSNIHSTKIRMTILIIAVLGALFAILLVMLSCICHLLYKCVTCEYSDVCPCGRRKSKSPSECESAASSIGKIPGFCSRSCTFFTCSRHRRPKTSSCNMVCNDVCSGSQNGLQPTLPPLFESESETEKAELTE